MSKPRGISQFSNTLLLSKAHIQSHKKDDFSLLRRVLISKWRNAIELCVMWMFSRIWLTKIRCCCRFIRHLYRIGRRRNSLLLSIVQLTGQWRWFSAVVRVAPLPPRSARPTPPISLLPDGRRSLKRKRKPKDNLSRPRPCLIKIDD